MMFQPFEGHFKMQVKNKKLGSINLCKKYFTCKMSQMVECSEKYTVYTLFDGLTYTHGYFLSCVVFFQAL